VDTFGQLIIQYTLLFNILADVFGLTLKYVWRRGSHPHLKVKLLILYHKYFTICKYTPIYTPK
jgi:hypothetical protein